MNLYELHKISHAYDGPPVLTIDRLSVLADTVTGVAGPNGSGKSTLFSLLGFIVKPTRGVIRFRGHPSLPFDDHIRGKVTLMTQDAFLLKRSVYNNIAYGLRIAGYKGKERQRVNQALKMVGLEPDAYARRLWYALSGGETRRVALAARLALRPDVLLMDEPTASVDAASAQMIKEAAMHARQQWGTSLIISSHDGEWLADISDHVVHLFRGRILGNGKQTLIFGPWKTKARGIFVKPLTGDQFFEARGTPEKPTTAVAAIEATHLGIYNGSEQVPPQNHRLKGLLMRLNYEQSIDRISAAVLVGGVVFNVYLDPPQAAACRFNPGHQVWIGYDPRAVDWY